MSDKVLRPVGEKNRYSKSAYTAIKEAILEVELAPGQPLVEEQLAAMLQISRTPVREALAILQHEGLIGPRGGRGLYVRPLTREEFVELFTANEVVEPYLARRAAQEITEDQLQVLGEVVSRGRYYADRGNLPQFLRTRRDFLRLLGVAAGNAPLTDFVVRNEERADFYLLSCGRRMGMEDMQASNREHAAILEALIRRDAEEAARLAVYHTQSLRHRLADLFANPDESPEDDWLAEEREYV